MFFVIVIIGSLLPFVLVGAVYVWLAGMVFLLPLIAALYVSLGVVLIIRTLNRRKREKVIYRVLLGAVLLAVVYAIPGIYDKTRPVLQDGYVETSEYAPFSEKTKVVTLNETPTLKIEDDLPIIDGATA